jgi:TolB protein
MRFARSDLNVTSVHPDARSPSAVSLRGRVGARPLGGRLRLVWASGAMLLCATTATAQRAGEAPQPPGVRLGLQYRPGQKVAVVVLPVGGIAGDSIGAILARDLDYSDRYALVTARFGGPGAAPPAYPILAKVGADAAVHAVPLPSGGVRVVLHDVGRKAEVAARDFPLPAPALAPAWRMAVHGIADTIEEWISGERGIAQTRIAFTRDGRVWTVDSDGENVVPVSPVGMSPQWVPGGRALVYSVLDGVRNPILLKDLATGGVRTLAGSGGVEHMTPAVSPDGRLLVYARGTAEGTDLVAVPLAGGEGRRITIGRGRASTQPTFSPDGARLAFMSDRSGHPEVYISDVDGANVELLTVAAFGDRDYRASPDWSPDGRLVAFQSRNGGAFHIMTINLRDQSVRQVTDVGRNDDPSWAPDSRHLVFTSTRSGSRQLWVADIETGRARQLRCGTECRLAAWSPRLLP